MQESAISRRIRDIEDNIGASLFHRHSAAVRLTVAGETFLPRAREIVRHIGESGADVVAIGRAEHGRIRIGNLVSPSSGFLCELLCSFRVSHPGVATELVDGAPADLIAEIPQLRLVAFVAVTRDCGDAIRRSLDRSAVSSCSRTAIRSPPGTNAIGTISPASPLSSVRPHPGLISVTA